MDKQHVAFWGILFVASTMQVLYFFFGAGYIVQTFALACGVTGLYLSTKESKWIRLIVFIYVFFGIFYIAGVSLPVLLNMLK